jgi:lysophospholipid hydrolase
MTSTPDLSSPGDKLFALDRFAKTLLHAIEQRIMFIQAETSRTLNLLIQESLRQTQTVDDLTVTARDLELHVNEWITLVEPDPHIRAALILAIATKYTLVADKIPNIRRILGLDLEPIRDAFLTQYGRSIDSIYSLEPVDSDQGAVARSGETKGSLLRLMQDMLRWKSVVRGDYLFREGDPSDGMYIILHGRLRAFHETHHRQTTYLRDMGPGETVGEMSIITHEPRSASILVLRDSLLLHLTHEAFETLADRHPRFLLSITQTLVERLSHAPTNVVGSQTPRTLAFVPLGDAVPLAQFFQQLSDSVKQYGNVLHLNKRKAVFESMLKNSQVDSAALTFDSPLMVSWLNEQESRYSHILYEADPSDNDWTTRCLRQADKIILVGKAGNDPALYEVEKTVLNDTDLAEVKRELILLHPDHSKMPTGTDRWLDVRNVERHYHISLTTKPDFERLARAFTGHTIGLVLSGGGARGFAHAGVVRAMHEANIPIDAVCGTSSGSIAAALIAKGADYEEIMEKAKFLFGTFNDYTFPLVSVMAGKKLLDGLKLIFGDLKIEDLWTDFFCVSSNLNQAQMVVHRRGLLYKAVRASASMPGVFPPVVSPEGDLLIDGAVMNNVPADLMQDYIGGMMVIVDVGNEAGRRSKYSFGESVSGWRLLLNRINPLRSHRIKAPSIMSVMSRATFLASMQHKSVYDSRNAFYLKPPVGNYSPFSVDDSEAIVDIGYEFAREKIAEWQPALNRKKHPNV